MWNYAASKAQIKNEQQKDVELRAKYLNTGFQLHCFILFKKTNILLSYERLLYHLQKSIF